MTDQLARCTHQSTNSCVSRPPLPFPDQARGIPVAPMAGITTPGGGGGGRKKKQGKGKAGVGGVGGGGGGGNTLGKKRGQGQQQQQVRVASCRGVSRVWCMYMAWVQAAGWLAGCLLVCLAWPGPSHHNLLPFALYLAAQAPGGPRGAAALQAAPRHLPQDLHLVRLLSTECASQPHTHPRTRAHPPPKPHRCPIS